jgi:hypothetical protein
MKPGLHNKNHFSLTAGMSPCHGCSSQGLYLYILFYYLILFLDVGDQNQGLMHAKYMLSSTELNTIFCVCGTGV